MDTQKKYRWALTGLLIMIALNVATLFTLWMNKPDGPNWRQHRMDEHGRTAVHQFMKNELGLSESQVDSMAALRRQHFREMDALRKELESSRRAYFDFMMGKDADQAPKRDSLMSRLANQYIEVEGALYNHMSEMKTVLNSDQQQKFKVLMKDTFLRNNRREGAQNSGGKR
jgi:Spy/CpxP family protein refolding chaperone